MNWKSVGILSTEMFLEGVTSILMCCTQSCNVLHKLQWQGHAFLCTTCLHTPHLQRRVGMEELLCYLLLLN